MIFNGNCTYSLLKKVIAGGFSAFIMSRHSEGNTFSMAILLLLTNNEVLCAWAKPSTSERMARLYKVRVSKYKSKHMPDLYLVV